MNTFGYVGGNPVGFSDYFGLIESIFSEEARHRRISQFERFDTPEEAIKAGERIHQDDLDQYDIIDSLLGNTPHPYYAVARDIIDADGSRCYDHFYTYDFEDMTMGIAPRFPRKQVSRKFNSQKKAKDASNNSPAGPYIKKGSRRPAKPEKHKKGSGHYHDGNHNNRNKPNIHYEFPD